MILRTLKLAKNLAVYFKSNEADQVLREQSAKFLSQFFESEKGLFLKVGQMMGSNPEALEEIQNLAKAESEHFIKLEEMMPHLDPEFQTEIEKRNIQFYDQVHVASLSQIHLGIADDAEFALKIQYPGIREKIDSQFRLLNFTKTLQKFSPLGKFKFSFSEYLEEFQQTLERELDYAREIANIAKFENLNKDRNVSFPRVVASEAKGRSYLMTKVHGKDLFHISKTMDAAKKRSLADQWLMLYFRQFFVDGFIQGDTQFGNFLIQEMEPLKIAHLDFGQFIDIPKERRKAAFELLSGIISGADINVLNLLQNLGMDPEKLKYLGPELPVVLSELLWFFTAPHRVKIANMGVSERIDKILEEKKWWFRSAGDAEFFMLIKSWMGMSKIFAALDIGIDWQNSFLEIKKEAEQALAGVKLKPSLTDPVMLGGMAKDLIVEVTKNGKAHVNVTLPARALIDLEEFISPEVVAAMTKKGMDLHKIKKDILASGLKPGLVFQQESGEKSYFVSLR